MIQNRNLWYIRDEENPTATAQSLFLTGPRHLESTGHPGGLAFKAEPRVVGRRCHTQTLQVEL